MLIHFHTNETTCMKFRDSRAHKGALVNNPHMYVHIQYGGTVLYCTVHYSAYMQTHAWKEAMLCTHTQIRSVSSQQLQVGLSQLLHTRLLAILFEIMEIILHSHN